MITLDRSEDGRVATLTLATEHPANVFTTEVLDGLLARVREVRADRDVRVLVLRGRADVFSGGADLTLLGGLDDDAYRHYIATEYTLFAEVEALPLITVAVLAGACIGNATELALACDLRVAAADTRIGLPEMRVGFVAPAQRLAAYVGVGRAKELLYSGRLLGAAEAAELGLVTAVADEGDLAGTVESTVRRHAAAAPFALPFTKAGIHRAYGLVPLEGPAAGRFDAQEQAAAFATFRGPDFAEGAAAALAGRRAGFTGRRAEPPLGPGDDPEAGR